MEFITIVHPADKDSTELKRQAHSHAARMGHARSRRRRMADFRRQNENIDQCQSLSKQFLEYRDCDIGFSNPSRISISRPNEGPPIPKTISGAFEHEPLASFLKSLTSQEHFMFNYCELLALMANKSYQRSSAYVFLDVQNVVPDMIGNCSVMGYLDEHHQTFTENWMINSSTDECLLRGSLLVASRHLSLVFPKEYAELAVRYKLKHVQALRDAISTGGLGASRRAVATALILTYDEVS